MLGLSARLVGFYAAFAFPIALFCAIPYVDDNIVLDETQERRRLRTARVLALLAPVHVVFPLTALGIVRDADRLASRPETNERQRRLAHRLTVGGLCVAAVVFVVVTRDA